MTFLLDHDIPEDICRLLLHRGYEVIRLREVLPITTPDEDIFGYVCQHNLVLMTCNRDDFLQLAAKVAIHPGVIILIRRRHRQAECARLAALLSRAGEAGILHNVNFA